MITATKQPSFVLDERHKAWIRDNWPELASHFDLFHLEYIRADNGSKSYEVLNEGQPTGRYLKPSNVNPITLADVAPALCPCCGRLEPADTDAKKLDQEIQQHMQAEAPPPITPWLLLAIFAVAVLIAVIQWVAAIVRVAS